MKGKKEGRAGKKKKVKDWRERKVKREECAAVFTKGEKEERERGENLAGVAKTTSRTNDPHGKKDERSKQRLFCAKKGDSQI